MIDLDLRPTFQWVKAPTPIWAIMPVLAGPEMTMAAISDLLAQSVPLQILIVNQGVDDAFRTQLEQIAEQHPSVMVWHHVPSLPSLAATWNRALDAAWEAGCEQALVVNNDVRLHRETVEELAYTIQHTGALFVTAVGVTAEQFNPSAEYKRGWFLDGEESAPDQYNQWVKSPGGPDFSCFLISRECHARFRFDEGHIPAFTEDLSYHRDLMLAGEGHRIFSVNLPYLHLSSQTLKTLSAERRMAIEYQISSVSRVHYAKCWGGPVNAETYLRKGDPTSAVTDGSATTPYLQAHLVKQEPTCP